MFTAGQNRAGSSFQGDGTIHKAFGNTCGIYGKIELPTFPPSMLMILPAVKPETALVEGEGNVNAPLSVPGGFTQAALVNSATGAAGAFAGWAMSSLGKKVNSITSSLLFLTKLPSKLAPSDLQSTIASPSDGTASTPPVTKGSALIGAGMDIQSQTPPSTSLVQPKGLRLGGSKTDAKAVVVQLAEQVAAEENSTWGNNDLMDVNADEGDWSKPSHLLECTTCSLCARFKARSRARLPSQCQGLPRRPTLDSVLHVQVPQRVRQFMTSCVAAR